jgi:hypothetical protein
MKKILTYLVIAILCLNATAIQMPSITMTTTKGIGTAFTFDLRAKVDNTSIMVDFGDGTLVDQIINNNNSTISGIIIGSQTIKIYGVNINYLDCSNNQLTTLDVTGDSELNSLFCNNNILSALDVTKNTILAGLYCNDNKINTLDLTNNLALNILFCYNNQLSVLNVSNNIALFNWFCCKIM